MPDDLATKNVLVLMGGPDAERPVSLVTGRAVAAALRDSERYANVIEEVIERPTADELRELIDRQDIHVVFPALHGHWGEGGPLQALLEEVEVPYVGSRPRPAALAMDKLITKMLIGRDGIPTPSARELRPGETCDLDPPLVLKPVDDGSSVDLRICRDHASFDDARRELEIKRPRLMAERFIPGRELTVGIVHDRALPVIEIVPADGAYDYAAKYDRDDTVYRITPELPDGVTERCRGMALRAHRILGCRDLSRVDFILDDDGGLWLLEVNTMPGFTPHSLVPMASAYVGRPMPALCASLVESALVRGPTSRAQMALSPAIPFASS